MPTTRNKRSGPFIRVLFMLGFLGLTSVASAQTTIEIVNGLDPLSGGVTEIEPGDLIFIRVEEGPQDLAPFNNRIQATVSTVSGGSVFCGRNDPGDTESLVYLFETNADGVYTGFIHTSPGSIRVDDGNLQVSGGDRIVVNFNGVTDTAEVITNGDLDVLELREPFDFNANALSAGLPDHAAELKLITAGNPFLIRVEDGDQNCDFLTTDQVTATVVTVAGDTEVVTLTETGIDTGVFVATVNTTFGAGVSTAGDGEVNIQSGPNAVLVTYVDLFRTDIDNLPVVSGIDVRAGTDGVITLGSPVVLGGNAPRNNFLDILVVDADADFSIGPGNDSVYVTVRSFNLPGGLAGGGSFVDMETFVITEDPVTAGNFTRLVPIQAVGATDGVSNTKIVDVFPGGSVEVVYNDDLRASGEIDSRVVVAFENITNAQAGQAVTVFSQDPIELGGPSNTTHNTTFTTIQVTDLDEDLNAGPGNDSVLVTVRSISGPASGSIVIDRETFELYEDTLTPGLFTRTIDIIRLRSINPQVHVPVNDELIEVVPTGGVDYVYLDRITDTGVNLPISLNVSVTALQASPPPIVFQPATITIGGPTNTTHNVTSTTIQITDLDENFTVGPGNDTITVTIQSFDGANNLIDSDVLDLPEDETTPGVFIRTLDVIRVRSNNPPSHVGTSDELIEVVAGGLGDQGRVDVVYRDPFNATDDSLDQPILASALVTALQTFPPPLAITSPIELGGPANTTHNATTTTITLSDLDQNLNAGPGNDSITVTVRSFDNGGVVIDEEVLIVPESQTVAGTFSRTLDVIRVRSINPQIHVPVNDELLEVVPTGTVEVVYIDPFNATNDELDQAVAQVSNVTALQLLANINHTITPNPIILNRQFTTTNNVSTTTISLTDLDQNLNVGPGNDTVVVTVSSVNGANAVIDRETIVLNEDPDTAGLFRRSVEVIRLRTPAAGAPFDNVNDGRIEVVPGGIVESIYIDPFRQDDDSIDVPVPAQATVDANQAAAVAFVDLITSPTGINGPIRLGHVQGNTDQSRGYNSVTILITDVDKDIYAGPGNDSVFVTLRSFFNVNANILDEETVEVEEDPNIPGTFVKTLPVRTEPAVQNNGILEARITQNVQFAYIDEVSDDGINVERLATTQVSGGDNGCDGQTAITAPSTVNPTLVDGRGLFTTIVVEDVDENRTNGPGNDSITVTVSAYDGICNAAILNNAQPRGQGNMVDIETIEIYEDPNIEGLFRLQIPTTFGVFLDGVGNPDQRGYRDGTIQIRAGGSIEFFYNDDIQNGVETINSPCYQCVDVDAISGCDIEIVSENTGIGVDVTRLTPGDEVVIEVTAANFNVSNGIDTLPVSLTASHGNLGTPDIEDLLLYETANASGVFTGSMQTIFGTAIPDNGTLEVRGTTNVTVSFVDRLGQVCADGGVDVAQIEIDGQVRFLSNGGRHEIQGSNQYSLPNLLAELRVSNDVLGNRLAIRAGDPFYLVLSDDDLNTEPTIRDSFDVTVASFRQDGVTPHDEITVTLVEVADQPGGGGQFNTGVFFVDPAVFPNGRRTRLVSPGTAAVLDTILEVEAGGFVRVAYNDNTVPRPALGAQIAPGFPEVRLDEMNIQNASDAVITLADQETGSNQFVKAGRNIIIQVSDLTPLSAGTQSQETGHDPNVIDTIRVTVTSGVNDSLGNPDYETVTLYETDVNSHIWRGIVPTTHSFTSIRENGVVEMADTSVQVATVTVTYVDPQPLNPNPAGSNIRIGTQTIQTLLGRDGAVRIFRTADPTNFDEVLLGDTITVSVSDPDLAVGVRPGSIGVTVTTPSGDVEHMRLDNDPNNPGAATGNPGDYVGFIKTIYMESFQYDNNLLEMTGGPIEQAVLGEPVKAEYTDNLTADGRMMIPRSATILGFYQATVHIVNRRLDETEILRSAVAGGGLTAGSEMLFIKVIDPDLDVPPARNTTYTTPTIGGVSALRPTAIIVTVRNNITGALVDSESNTAALTLSELRRTNGESRNNIGETIKGVFANATGVPISYLPAGIAGGTFDNGVIDIIGNDTITVTYVDTNTNGLHPELNRSASTSAQVRADGNINIVESSTSMVSIEIVQPMEIGMPGTIFIKVQDKDLDSDNLVPPASVADAGPVVTLVTDAGDVETFAAAIAGVAPRMTEANNPGEFRNFTNNIPGMSMVYGQPIPGNNVVELVQGDLITVSYQDVDNIEPGVSTRRSDTANASRSTSGRIEILNPVTGRYQEPNGLEQFIIGEPLVFRVFDGDQDRTSQADTISVTITTNNPVKPDAEGAILTEAVNGAFPIAGGVFQSSLQTDFHKLGNTAQNNGVLTLAGGDTITISYNDILDAANKARTVQATIGTATTYRETVTFASAAVGNHTVRLPNGTSLTIPQRALQSDQEIKLELKYRDDFIDEYGNRVPGPLNPQIVLAGDSGRVGFHEIQPSALVFKKPATLEIHVPQTVTIQGQNVMLNNQQRQQLRVFYFDGFDWEPANGEFITRQDDNGILQEFIRTQTNHLTVYSLGLDDRPPPPLTGPILSELSVDKNPFSPNGDNINDVIIIKYFLGRNSTISIRVLDSNGNLVRTLADRVPKRAGFNTDLWDGSYIFGDRIVPSGIYIVNLKATGGGATDEQSLGIGVVK